jgi:cell division protein FtsB
MFKSKMMLAALAVTALAFGGMAIAAKIAADDVKVLTAQVEQLKAEHAVKQAEVNTLAAAVELSDYTLARVLAERESITAIRAKADAEQARLRTELTKANAQVAQLRVSTNEHVKDWANTVVPTDAVRLLKYAAARSYHPDSDSNQASIPITTGRLVTQLPTG